jgi:3-phosphoshikimate 1-carboxyvinyltransferase
MDIDGARPLTPVRVNQLADHRLVMSAAVAALAASGPSMIGDAAAVGKSFPEFWQTLESLGATSRVVRP